MTSISVAAPFTHLEGDDKRLMTGNMNKSSSLGPQAALPLSYSAKANNIKAKKKKKKSMTHPNEQRNTIRTDQAICTVRSLLILKNIN